VRYVKAALARVSAPAGPAAVDHALAGSPPSLASLHQQADQLLGKQSALAERIRALRGLAAHSVSYPSYQTTTPDLSLLATIEGLPTTIFISRAGKVAYVHTGQYDSQGTLDQDISNYALSG